MKPGLRIVALIGGVMLLFSMVIGPGILGPPITLLFGWLPASARLCGAWHPGVTEVILFGLALVIVVAGAHRFLRWVYGTVQPKEPAAEDGCATSVVRWRWKWTLCGFGIFICTLVAISCLVLTTHQIYWISKSSDPLLADPFREKVTALIAGQMFLKAADEMGWDTSRARNAFSRIESPVPGQFAFERFQPVWIEQNEHLLHAVLLVPRKPLYRERAAFIIIQRDAQIVMRKLDDLPKVLAAFGIESPRGESAGLTGLRP